MNVVTVESVLKTMYMKMEVGKNISHLVVVGDGKTYDYLLKLKDEDPIEMAWLLPFPGDWHTLKNYSLALLKIYGPAGLHDLISILHMGRTEKCVLNSTDFEKTFAFIVQSWEAMYRVEISLFLDSLERGSDEGAAAAFSKNNFLKEVAVKMKKWENIKEPAELYIEAFQSLSGILDGLYDEFNRFSTKLCESNENFRFWHNYIHTDCMAYICLYLAGRSGDWELRNHALKLMMPLFHVVNSTFYYRLLPRHIYDLQQFPDYIMASLRAGGFVMSFTDSF